MPRTAGCSLKHIGATTIPLNHTLTIPKKLNDHARERRGPNLIILRLHPYALFFLSFSFCNEFEQS